MTESTDNKKGEWMGRTVKRQMQIRMAKMERKSRRWLNGDFSDDEDNCPDDFGKNWGQANGVTKGRSRR